MTYRILVLNLIPNTIGDNVLLTSFLKLLKDNYPSSRITLTVSPLNSQIFWNNPCIDKLFEVEGLVDISKNIGKLKKGLIYLKMMYNLIRELGDHDICFILLPNFPLNVLIPLFLGVKERVGYTYKWSFLSFLLTKKVKYRGLETGDYERHFVEAYIDLLRACDLKVEKPVARIYLTDDEVEAAFKKLSDKGVVGEFVCFHCGTKKNGWPIDRFGKVARWLRNKYGYSILLLGADSEFEFNQRIVGDGIYNLCGEFNLREIICLLSKAKFSVCNDSGISHLSSAVGTSTVVLYGPHHPSHCKPIGPGKVYVVYKGFETPYAKRGSEEGVRRINAIGVIDVMHTIEDLLKEFK
jgi:heptosyltransferase-2